MEESIAQSPLADRVTAESYIVLHRSAATPRALAEIRATKVFEPGPENSVCELVSGGVCIASGKLVKKRGQWCFYIESLGEDV